MRRDIDSGIPAFHAFIQARRNEHSPQENFDLSTWILCHLSAHTPQSMRQRKVRINPFVIPTVHMFNRLELREREREIRSIKVPLVGSWCNYFMLAYVEVNVATDFHTSRYLINISITNYKRAKTFSSPWENICKNTRLTVVIPWCDTLYFPNIIYKEIAPNDEGFKIKCLARVFE